MGSKRPLSVFRHTNLWSLGSMTLFAYAHLASAIQIYTPEALPTDLSSGCAGALTTDVAACPLFATKLRYGFFYPESTLLSVCTSECSSALQAYEKSVVSSCSNDTWLAYEDDEEQLPVAFIPNVLRYLYELTCIQDNGRFCNAVAGTNAAMADPGDGDSGWLGGVANGTSAPDCDLCFIKNLRMQAGSPYYDGPEVASQSIYESKTSSCGIAGMPRTTWAMPTTVSDLPRPTPPACAGKTYQIQPGDDCHSISTSQGIATSWLLSDNNLASFCTDFPTEGSLCLTNTCSVYTVQTNDTCKSVAKASNITEALLISWNPALSSGCGNIGRYVGDQICISVPGTPYQDPSSTVLAPTTVTAPVPVPTDVAPGVNDRCGRYYKVMPDEYCNLIVLHFGISLEDFRFLNPDINDNCTNLFAYESYCVLPVGDINTYPGRAGATTAPPTTTRPFTSILSLDPTTSIPPIVTPVGSPLAPNTRGDCSRYFNGAQMLNEDITGTSFANACQFAAALWAVSLDDLMLWNPDLGNLTSGECNMDPELRYCGKNLFADPPPDPVSPDYDFEIREGAIEDCTEYGDAYSDWDCNDILANYELTIAQFFKYNPEVGADCSNLWPEYAYCIRAGDYVPPTSTSSLPPTTTPTPTGPPAETHTGQPANCNKWHVVKDGDGCDTIEAEYGLTADQFFEWNPAVSRDCLTNFWLGYAYCVGVSSSSSSSPPPTTTTTTAAPTPTPSTPSPVQEGNAVANCNAYAQVQDGDWCAAFAERNDVREVDLYAWNTVLGDSGENCGSSFWAGYWYCIGVAAARKKIT
ncbi:hypothetical protein F4777DRAFT_596051 [Nemania sp. FL0916]|nr:hypothetical protein F4777DRAFT_596051 [Nemania sp. FL0916]